MHMYMEGRMASPRLCMQLEEKTFSAVGIGMEKVGVVQARWQILKDKGVCSEKAACCHTSHEWI